MKSEKGFTLIEILVSLVLLSMIAVAFLSALATSSKAILIVDERSTAINLACRQMEYVKSENYAASYTPAPIPNGKDYVGYSANITAEPLHDPDDGIQKITVKIEHNNKVVTTLEAYKVNR